MSLEGLIGIVLGIVGILVSVYFALRSQKNRLVVFESRCVALFDEYARNMPDLAIAYEGRPISESLLSVRLHVTNTSGRDITPNMVDEPIRLRLADGLTWIRAVITGLSPELKADLALEGAVVTITHQQLRSKEGVTIEALVQSGLNSNQPVGSILDYLECTARVSDFQNLEKRHLTPNYSTSFWKFFLRTQWLLMLFWIVQILNLAVRECGVSHDVGFEMEGERFQIVSVGSEKVELERQRDGKEIAIPSDEFYATPVKVADVERRRGSILWLLGAVGFLFCFVVLIYARTDRRTKNMWKIIRTQTQVRSPKRSQ